MLSIKSVRELRPKVLAAILITVKCKHCVHKPDIKVAILRSNVYIVLLTKSRFPGSVIIRNNYFLKNFDTLYMPHAISSLRLLARTSKTVLSTLTLRIKLVHNFNFRSLNRTNNELRNLIASRHRI